MTTSTAPQLRTAQANFLRWMGETTSVAGDTALSLWCQVNAWIESRPSLARLRVVAGSAAAAEDSYTRVEFGIAPLLRDIAQPVLAALGFGLLALVISKSALVAAVVTLVVFCVLLFRQGGSLQGIDDWIRAKLSSLRAFSA